MIRIEKTENTITIKGHAGAGVKGEDLVCCAVSVLFQNLIYSIRNLTVDKIEFDISPGNSWVRYKNLSEAGKLLMDSFFVGATAVADANPDYVRAWMT